MRHGNTTDRSGKIKAVNPLRFLLPEDDCKMRRLLAFALRSDSSHLALCLGAMRYGIADGPEFDIIADVRMPGPSGIAMLADLYRVGKTKPFIVITAFGDDKIHAEALRLGAAAVFDEHPMSMSS